MKASKPPVWKHCCFPVFLLKIRSGLSQFRNIFEVPVLIIDWTHWETGKTDKDWILAEASKLAGQIRGRQVNLLAKSIGTAVAMCLLKTNRGAINKIILCGLPLEDLSKDDKTVYSILADFPSDKIICFQNENDNHGSFSEVQSFLHSINLEIRVVKSQRSDHEYPYSQRFIEFLQN